MVRHYVFFDNPLGPVRNPEETGANREVELVFGVALINEF